MALQASITLHQDLRTGRPIWLSSRRPAIAVKALSRPVSCDVLVVGAGISGALIAENLTDAGLNVVLVDRRGPVEGSTAASTALLQYELDTPMIRMALRIGEQRTQRLWRRSRLAVDALHERADWLGIHADMVERTSLYLDGDVLDAEGLALEAEARRRAGFQVELLGPAQVQRRYGIAGRHAILGSGNACADPRRLAAGFLNAALGRGARLFANVDVTGIAPSAEGVKAQATSRGTAHSVEISARHVVFATGYEMPKGIPHMGNRTISTWCIATGPQPGRLWPTQAMIWEASDPYLYLRTTPRGQVICGGEDEEVNDSDRRDALIPEKSAILSRRLQALFPGLDCTPAFAWAGSFGTSPLGSPTIGRVPGMANCYAAMGYGGNGITFSMMAAQMLRTLITGGRDPDSDLVGFRRKF